jgi:hypothetical protein
MYVWEATAGTVPVTPGMQFIVLIFKYFLYVGLGVSICLLVVLAVKKIKTYSKL